MVYIVEVTNIRTYSHKTNKLQNVYTIGNGARNTSIKKWEINYFKIKIIPFIIVETMSFVMDKSKTRASVSKEFTLSYDVASGSEITPCNKICKPLVVYRFSGNVMTSITTLRT